LSTDIFSARIKKSTIVLIAAVVAFLIHSMRWLEYFNLKEVANPDFTQPSIPDIFVRMTAFFLYSWLIIKFNLIWINKYFSEVKKVIKYLITIIGNVVIAFSLFLLFDIFYKLLFGIKIPELEQRGAAFGWFIVLIVLLLIVQILKIQLRSRKMALEKEQLKQEKLASELVAIKNQINPHFLFNSLNTLNSVIRNNPERATDFVDKLSFMYRYILQSSEQNLVNLTEELEFLDSFVYLIKIRYGNKFELKNTLSLDLNLIKIPVLSLQILVENAVKHNEISEDNPLLVKMYNDDEFIIVENKISPRNSLEESTGNGLLTLSRRYKLLKENDIKIYKNSNFKVKLPI